MPLKQIKFYSMDIVYKSETKFMDVFVWFNENVNWDVPSSKLSKSYYVLQFLIDITGLYITRSIYFAQFFPTAAML